MSKSQFGPVVSTEVEAHDHRPAALKHLVSCSLCDLCGAYWASLWGGSYQHYVSLQPPLFFNPAPSHQDGSDSSLSDSEESVFSGLEDSGSDSSDDNSEGEDGTSHSAVEQTSREQVQVGE
jgi:hypothetical protein